MKLGPQIECRGCGLPVLLSFTWRDGVDRRLVCPFCAHTHTWTVTDVTEPARGGRQDRTATGSSVE